MYEANEELIGLGPRERWLSSFNGPAGEPAESVTLGVRGAGEVVLVSTAAVSAYAEPGGVHQWAVNIATQVSGLDGDLARNAAEEARLQGAADGPVPADETAIVWSCCYDWGGVRAWVRPAQVAVAVVSASGRRYGPEQVREVRTWGEYEIDGSVPHDLQEMRIYRAGHGPIGRELDTLSV